MPDIKGLSEFFDYIWQTTEGFVYLPTINKGQQITKYMYRWPAQKNAVVKHVLAQDALGNDVFYSPAIYAEAKPLKENVAGTHIFWTDFDGNAPKSWEDTSKKFGIPEPTLVVRSSVEGREHAYWKLAGFEQDIEQIDSRNRALAYTLGADSSGWDANQFLRPPFTHNYGFNNQGKHKDWYTGDPVNVRILSHTEDRTNPNTFNPLGTPENIISRKIVLKTLPSLPSVFMDGHWPEDFRTLFNYSKDEAGKSSEWGRSGALQRLGYLGAENGFTDEQIYVVINDADDRWEKYKGRHDHAERLLDIIAKARAKVGYIQLSELNFSGLLASAPVVTDSKLVYSFQELMELEVHVDWFLQDLLRNEGVGIVTGPPGVGKTQFSIQLGAHMALGLDFLGWKNNTSPKKVLLFSLEMGVVPIKIFWDKIKLQYQGDIAQLHKNFYIVPLGEGIPLETKKGQEFFEKVIEEYKPDIIIVDSLQKVTSKELTDELAVKTMLEFLDGIRLRQHASMVFVHHNRKKTNDGTSNIPLLDDMYGSRFIAANIDFVLNLRSLVKNVITIDSVKNRLGSERDSFEITRNENLQYELGTGPIMEGLLNGNARDVSQGTGFGRGSGGIFKLGGDS